MNYREYKGILKKDRESYGKESHIKMYFLNNGYKITVNYRRCKFLASKKILIPLYAYQRVKYNRICVKYGCDIPSSASIGPGFKIEHPIGCIVNSKAVIGNNFNIKSGAIVGRNHRGVATIGDNVSLGVHSLVIGPVRIGNNVTVGAGAIVTHDVPDNETVIGTAAYILRKTDNIQN